PLEQLTKREREVLELVAEGRSNRAIAQALFVTESTVEAHVKQIFTKLALDTGRDSHRRVLAVLAVFSAQGDPRREPPRECPSAAGPRSHRRLDGLRGCAGERHGRPLGTTPNFPECPSALACHSSRGPCTAL